ncbi:MAG: hypothetical protein K9L17_10580 [Clostridiales bacterium]|nr:hypothetical protein [Clostridiales bacterium]MCF8023125.1 hypothetical protein [Clostridiales bacterium]
MSRDNNKVIEFDTKKKKKLKALDYVSPEKKEMLRKRKMEKQKKINRMRTIKSVGLFLLICIILYFLGPGLKLF